MGEFEVFFKNEGSEYGDGVVLNKYGDRYSIIAARESQQGTLYKDWAFPQGKDKKPKDKAIPLGCRLGNLKETIKTLRSMLQVLENPNMSGNTPASAASALGGRVVKPEEQDIMF